jgi:hypothetical protein
MGGPQALLAWRIQREERRQGGRWLICYVVLRFELYCCAFFIANSKYAFSVKKGNQPVILWRKTK